jgi:hypothetical protein
MEGLIYLMWGRGREPEREIQGKRKNFKEGAKLIISRDQH